MTRQPGICTIISSFHPVIGGAEKQAQQLAARLVEREIDVCVLTRRYQGLKNHEEIDGIPVYRMPVIGTGAFAAPSYIAFSLLWLFRHRHKYQILHCHQILSPTTIGLLAKLLWNKKVIAKVAGSDLGHIQKSPISHWRVRFLSHVNVFIALTDKIKQGLETLGIETEQIECIPNGVDIDKFCPVSVDSRSALRQELAILPDDRVALFVGRLVSLKGVDVLLCAWAKVAERIVNCRLLIMGGGPEEESLRDIAESLALNDCVTFVGYRDNVVDHLQAVDLFVMSSRSEGMPNALLEAMAVGLPCVASDIPGTRAVIQPGVNGLLFESGNVEHLANAIAELLADQKRAASLGRQARKTIETDYSMKSIAEQYIALYHELFRR